MDPRITEAEMGKTRALLFIQDIVNAIAENQSVTRVEGPVLGGIKEYRDAIANAALEVVKSSYLANRGWKFSLEPVKSDGSSCISDLTKLSIGANGGIESDEVVGVRLVATRSEPKVRKVSMAD